MRVRPAHTRYRRFALAAAAPVLLLAFTACGSGDNGPTVASVGSSTSPDSGSGTSNARSAADQEKSMREFAQCMRQNGVADFPDPTVDANGNARFGGSIRHLDGSPAGAKAMQACGSKLSALRENFSPEHQQEMQDAVLKYAQCMRENGYQMADPDFSGGGAAGGLRPLAGINRNDPAFKKADEVCRPKTLGNLTRPGGSASGSPSSG
jgi:hypothetical protein